MRSMMTVREMIEKLRAMPEEALMLIEHEAYCEGISPYREYVADITYDPHQGQGVVIRD
jgi:hypothetical protein